MERGKNRLVKRPRLILAAVAGGLAVPVLLWLGVAATAGGSDLTQLAGPMPQAAAHTPPASSLEPQAAGGDRVTPVAEPPAAPTFSARPDPLAATNGPTPRPTASNATSATPIPAATASAPASATSETPAVARPTPTPRQSPQATPSPPVETAPKPAKTPKGTPSRTPSRAPSQRPRTPQTPERIETTPQRGWSPPELTTGVNQLSFPRLTSGADVTITVACQPSAGCAMDAGTLTIEPGSSVTVTWSAPRTRTHTAWSVQRTFN